MVEWITSKMNKFQMETALNSDTIDALSLMLLMRQHAHQRPIVHTHNASIIHTNTHAHRINLYISRHREPRILYA